MRRKPRVVCPEKSICVVLVHQYTKMGGCAALMRGMANCFAAVGFPVVTFDMRGAGKSTGSATFTGQHEVKDVIAVCEFVQATLQYSVILVGSSAGTASCFERKVSVFLALRCVGAALSHALSTTYTCIQRCLLPPADQARPFDFHSTCKHV